MQFTNILVVLAILAPTIISANPEPIPEPASELAGVNTDSDLMAEWTASKIDNGESLPRIFRRACRMEGHPCTSSKVCRDNGCIMCNSSNVCA